MKIIKIIDKSNGLYMEFVFIVKDKDETIYTIWTTLSNKRLKAFITKGETEDFQTLKGWNFYTGKLDKEKVPMNSIIRKLGLFF